MYVRSVRKVPVEGLLSLTGSFRSFKGLDSAHVALLSSMEAFVRPGCDAEQGHHKTIEHIYIPAIFTPGPSLVRDNIITVGRPALS